MKTTKNFDLVSVSKKIEKMNIQVKNFILMYRKIYFNNVIRL